MKRWFALAVSMLLLMSCCVHAEQLDYTFEMFYSNAGLPYEGEWVSIDDAFYAYLPKTHAADELTEEQRASGVIAAYSVTDEWDTTLTVQISRQEDIKTQEEITENLSAVCPDGMPIRLNGLPAFVGMDGCRVYVGFLLEGGAAYRVGFLFSGNVDAIDEVNPKQAMCVYSILYSISAAPLEIDSSKIGAAPAWIGRKETSIPERLTSEYSIHFVFHDRMEEDLQQLNRMLAAMELTDLALEDIDGYLSAMQELNGGAVVNTTYRYGLDSGTLVCKKEAFADGYQFQIATDVVPKSEGMTAKQYADAWKASHPDQKLRTLQEIQFEGHTAFLLLYFEAAD